MFKEIRKLNKHIASLRGDFETFIKNKEVSLEERWKLFEEAPDCLSKHEPFIVHFPPFAEDLEKNMYHGHNGGTFSATDVIDTIYENVIGEIMDTTDLDRDKNPEAFEDPKLELQEPRINQMKEFFLQENIKSWEFDW